MKLSIAFIFFITLISTAVCQPLTHGEQSIGLGIGVPAISGHVYSSRNPAFTGIYEYGFTEKLGFGYIGGGALLSISGSKYDYRYLNTPQSSTYNYVVMGPRASYHFDMVELTSNQGWSKVDVYGGMFLGVKFQTHKYTNHLTKKEVKSNKSTLCTDIFAGIRYGFNDKFGAFAEFGFGVTYINLGVSMRF